MMCCVDGCTEEKISARGMCRFHYRRQLAGKPLVARPTAKNARQWLLDHVSYQGAECLAWPFARDPKHGRGFVGWDNRTKRETSRLMCELAHGAPPTPEHQAAHSCGKGHEGCVNPQHLSWKTRKENEADKVIHGTLVVGSRVKNAKLDESHINDIRELAAFLPNRVVAELYGVTRRAIDRVVDGSAWRHVA